MCREDVYHHTPSISGSSSTQAIPALEKLTHNPSHCESPTPIVVLPPSTPIRLASCKSALSRRVDPSAHGYANMSKFRYKHDRTFRLPSLVSFPTLVLFIFILYHTEFIHVTPLSRSKWTRVTPSHKLLNFSTVKQCALVAMVITSEDDYQNGTIDAWFHTLPKRQTNHVCCVSVRRSPSTSFHFQPSSTSCDTLFVPMIRDDQYLTISEKIHLGFSKITSHYDFRWLLKTDADSFVCFSRLLNLLQNYDPTGVTYLGYAESRNILLEDPAHKWYDPSMTDLVHNSRQPVVSGTGLYHPYMQGAGYVLSRGALENIRSILPSLRYSPMEDAMVGSWLLAFNAHWGVLNLDLRGRIKGCHVPEHLYISHYRKGPESLTDCLDANQKCAKLSEVRAANVEDISFLVTTHMENRGNQALELYHSIRAIFPTNEIIFGDMSPSDRFLQRLLARTDDRRLRGYSFPNSPMHMLKNSLVEVASGEYVCILQDVQRLSWETMMGTMLYPVQNDEVDISAGFLVFNPHMMNSSYGLVQYGYRFKQKLGWLEKNAIEPEMYAAEDSCTVHGTTGFLLGRRSFFKLNGWRDFGPFTEDEFHLRLYRNMARIRLVNSGVRHGYHYPLSKRKETEEEIRKYAPRICNELGRETGSPKKTYGSNVTLDCEKNIFKRAYMNPNVTMLNTFFRW